MIKIALASVYVDDQDEALKFYTDVLGFVKKQDIPLGDARWLTVVSPSGPEGVFNDTCGKRILLAQAF